MRPKAVINHFDRLYREPAVFYAESKTYLDSMDFIDFLLSEGWQILVPPFVVQVEKTSIEKFGQSPPEFIELAVQWGFVLHKFYND